MKFHVLTLFPKMVRQGLNTSIIGRAVENGLIEIECINIRDFSEDKHGKVDDYTYGGGAGMLMQAQPVYDAWKKAAEEMALRETEGVSSQEDCHAPRTIYVTPQGQPFTQKMARELAQEEDLIFLCGHYEGVDERVLEEIVTDYVSIGDYVLTGGELPAMVMIDAVARLVTGVLHNDESAQTESFHNDLLEYPQYSRPEIWRGKGVPEVLLSGDHSKIAAWRVERSKERTERFRPDLYAKFLEKEALIKALSVNKRYNIHLMESLSRGKAEILYHVGDNLLLRDTVGGAYMICGTLGADAEKMVEMIAPDATQILLSQEFFKEMLFAKLGEMRVMEAKQACYTQRNHLPVRYKGIRQLTVEHLDFVAERYEYESREYLRKQILAGALYGAFAEEMLIGFMGWHPEGSLGMLYVEPGFRGQGIAASLEAFCINLHLDRGFVPYGHIEVENEPSMRLQERLGLYLSKESLWWLER